MRYHLISAGLLAAAIALETGGFSGGGTWLLAAGVVCELLFWMRLARPPRKLIAARSGSLARSVAAAAIRHRATQRAVTAPGSAWISCY